MVLLKKHLSNTLQYILEFFKTMILFLLGLLKFKKLKSGGWHCENGQFLYRDRVLAWMVYLNTVPSQNGGGTDFLHQKLTLQPEAGTIVLWPASYTHVHRGGFLTGNVDKYIATGWFIREPT